MPRYYNNLPAGYDIAKINGVVFDFDPAKGVTIDQTRGNFLTQWVDANGYVATPDYSTSLLYFDPVAMNGLPGFCLDGFDDGLILNLAAQEACRGQTGGTLIVAVSVPKTVTALTPVFFLANGLAVSSGRQGFYVNTGNLPHIIARRRDNDSIYSDDANLTGAAFNLNEVNIYTVEWNYVNDNTAAAYTISKNGVVIYGPQTVATSNGATHTISAGTTPLGGISGTTVTPTPSKSVEIGGSTANGVFSKCRIGRLTYIKRILSPREKSLIVNARLAQHGITGNSILTPDNWQMYQMDNTGHANIAITGLYTGSPSHIQARVVGYTVGGVAYTGTWTNVDTLISGGSYTATLTGVPQGYYTLQTRQSNDSTIQFSRFKILVSDIFVSYGQSNSTDQTGGTPESCDLSYGLVTPTNPCPYTVSPYALTPSGIVFNGSCGYSRCFDVSGNPAYWALFCKEYFNAYKVPCGIIAAGIGGLNIDKLSLNAGGTGYTWGGIVGGDSFGVGQAPYARMLSMVSTATAGTGCKRVWWHQGEANAGTMDQPTYYSKLTALANQIQTDLGVHLMPCKLQYCINGAGTPYNNFTPFSMKDINNAIAQAWAAGGNIDVGPDFSDLKADKDPIAGNGYIHLLGRANHIQQAKRWALANAIKDGWPVLPQL